MKYIFVSRECLSGVLAWSEVYGIVQIFIFYYYFMKFSMRKLPRADSKMHSLNMYDRKIKP